MSSGDIHRAVARATGESVRAIKQFGFSLVAPDQVPPEEVVDDAGPQFIDWDELEAERIAFATQA
jgi:hypothetical protein